MTLLAGRRVWIIGASSGIGAALARELHGRGCNVAISARRREELESIGQSQMLVEPLDMRNHASVQSAFERITAQVGVPDVVVVVAGYWERMDAGTFDLAAFMRHIDVNVAGLAHCIDVVLPGMLSRRSGMIVGVASVAGYRGMPGSQGYGASKAAQLNLLESLRTGLRGSGVVVQSVAPGFVETPMTSTNTFPMPFMISAQEAARAIADGIESERAEVVFPKRMMVAMKLARLVPMSWWPRLFKARA